MTTIDYPDGSAPSTPIVLSDNNTDLQVLTGTATQAGQISQIGGSYGLEKIGSGTLILTANETYTGVTTITGGTLQLGNGSNTSGSLGGNIVNNAALALNYGTAAAVNYAGSITGTGSLTVDGGVISLTGDNNFSGGTTVISGGLWIGGAGGFGASTTTGSLTGNVSLPTPEFPVGTGSAYLGFGRSDDYTFSGNISGVGHVEAVGSGTLTLTGDNSAHTGYLVLYDGVLQVASDANLGGGLIRLETGTLRFLASYTSTLSYGLTGTAFDTNGHDVVLAGPLTTNFDANTPIYGGILKTGAGTLILTGTNTTTGVSTISQGTLQVGNGGTTGWLGSGSVVDNAELDFAHSDNIIVDNTISGTGIVGQVGTGILILTGANTYTGLTRIVAGGSVALSGNGSIANSSGVDTLGTLDISLANATSIKSLYGNGTVALGTKTLTITAGTGDNDSIFAGVIQDGGFGAGTGGSLTISGGAQALTGANTYTGTTTINSGALLQIGLGTTGTLGSGNVVDNGRLSFGRTDDITVNNAISGAGTLEQNAGSGVLTLTATNTYTGLTGITAGATLALSGSGSIANSSYLDNLGGTFDISGTAAGASVKEAVGSGSISLGSKTLTITAGNSHVFAGVIQDGGIAGGTGGSLVVASGIYGIRGTNTYTGTTTINSGASLYVGNNTADGNLGSGAVTDNGALIYNLTADSTVANTISGSGRLQQAGTANLILTGTDLYTGATDITAGTLSVNGAIASSAITVYTGGTLGGTGTVGATVVRSGAILAPGDGIGTLSVSGNLTLSAGAIWAEDVSATSADSVTVSGNVTLSGNLAENFAGGSFTPGTTYTLLTATGTVSGKFSSTSASNLPSGYASLISYDAHHVYMTMAPIPAISIGNASVTEGGILQFGVTLDRTTTQNVTLGYDTFFGTASMADNDYLGGPGTLTILAGQTTGTISIQTVQDTKVEPDETMSVHLLTASFGNITQGIGTGTIVNDDVIPNISIGNASVTEGGVLQFGVTLDQATTQNITLGYDTFFGTASMADNDYLGGPGTLTILAGQTTGTISIQTVQDSKFEPDETMSVHLLTASLGNITQAVGTGTIVNDDAAPPNISIGNASVTEGGVLQFGVTLSAAATQNITLSYDTFFGTASMADNDYLGGPGTLTILAGQTTGTIGIQTVQDSKFEPDETMSVHLLTANFGNITQAVGAGTIVNDDPVPPNISIGTAAVTEGGVLQFGVTLDRTAAQNITLSYDTFFGTASMADNDYLGGPGTLTILAGQTTGTISIQTVQDSKFEPNETMSVHLLSASLGNITQAVGTGTIVNDDPAPPPPNVSIGTATATEGQVLHFGVTLDRAASQNITLGYDTFAGSASSTDGDYLGGPGTLTILAGQTTGTIDIQTVQDSTFEAPETMSVHLLTTSYGAITQGVGTGLIFDDDQPPAASISNGSVLEGGLLRFAVSLNKAAPQDITLSYDTFAGTASMADNDYLGGPGTLTILAGQSWGMINIQTVQDAKVEPDETMSVHLLASSYGTIIGGIGTGTILNAVDPNVPSIAIGNSGTTEGGVLQFGVTLDRAASQNITLGYDTFAGTASMADNDYLGGPGTLTILAGQTMGTIYIQTVQDSKVEPDETMSVHLLSASLGNISQGIGNGTILNDDGAPNISIGNATVAEGGVLHFGVTLDAAVPQNIILGYDTFAGTASMADNDYLGGPGTLTIQAGQTTGTIDIQTVQDSKVEPDETMSVHLLGVTFGTVTQGIGTGTITNNTSFAATPGSSATPLFGARPNPLATTLAAMA